MAKKATNYLFEARKQLANASNSPSEVPRLNEKGASNTKVATPRKKKPMELLNAFSSFEEGKVTLELPIRTVSELNNFEPWRTKHKRHKEQQKLVSLWLSPLKGKIAFPCRILLTRFAPHELDAFDNLPASFKYIVDAVCSIITGVYTAGKADSDKRISIACHQVKSSKYGIRIEIMFKNS